MWPVAYTYSRMDIGSAHKHLSGGGSENQGGQEKNKHQKGGSKNKKLPTRRDQKIQYGKMAVNIQDNSYSFSIVSDP